MAKVVWTAGIEYVSGALCKCGKQKPHTHGRMLLATHRRAATTSDTCNRIYLRDEKNFTLSSSTNAMWARSRFKSIAEMVHQRSMDLSKLTQDQMNFLAQRNNPRGKKTMRSYYWYICGQEYDAQHPKGCIPQGWYRLTVTQSPKSGRLLPVLHMVPGFEGIRIHAGNNRDHTAGCILVGELSETALATASPDAHYAPTLFRSKQTEQTLVALILKAQRTHETIYMDITDTDHYAGERSALDCAFV